MVAREQEADGRASRATLRRAIGAPWLLARDLLVPDDRVVDRLLGADPLGHDAMGRLLPNSLLGHLAVPQVETGIVVENGSAAAWPSACDAIARVQPERLRDELAHRRQPSVASERQPAGDPAFLSQKRTKSPARAEFVPLLKTTA
jgi:hypothetical protein